MYAALKPESANSSAHAGRSRGTLPVAVLPRDEKPNIYRVFARENCAMGLPDKEDVAANAGGASDRQTASAPAKPPRGPMTPRTAAEIQQWFVAFLADALDTPPERPAPPAG